MIAGEGSNATNWYITDKIQTKICKDGSQTKMESF